MIESVRQSERSMEPILNAFAHTVGWLEGEITFSVDGHSVAFIDDGDVFAALDGHYLGRFEDGVFRDRLGCIVATLTGAGPCPHGGPQRGAPRPPEIRSRELPGRTHRAAAPSHPTKPLLDRSSLEWDGFVTASEARRPWETRL